MELRFEVIQYLIDTFDYKRYLELGCRRVKGGKLSVAHVNCEHKDSVDINNNGNNYVMTTDMFFETTPITQKYDIIFIDACHEKHAVLKDINNSLTRLNEGGVIVCHDINPVIEKQLEKEFCDNCWEAWAHLRSTREDLEMYALPIDLTGVIRKGKQITYDKPIEANWKYLNSNRKELLNLITVQEFKEIFKN